MLYLDLVSIDGNNTNSKVDFETIKLKYKLNDEPTSCDDQGNCINSTFLQMQRKSLEAILTSINMDPKSEKPLRSGSENIH